MSPAPAIDGIYERFSQAYRDLDPEAVARLYTTDALYLVPDKAIQRGRAEIASSFALFFERTRSVGLELEISFRIVERDVSDALAYDVGVYTLVSTRNGEEVGRSSGKFVIVARLDSDGTWRFQVDALSSLGRTSG